MKRMVVTAAWLGILATGVFAEPYADKAGPREVVRIDVTWRDAKRDRDVAAIVCYPKDLAEAKTEAVPVIVFSHGLGATRVTYENYGKYWASHGYIVIFPQHAGSDTDALLNGDATSAAKLVKSFVDRVGDVKFVLDQAEKLNAGTLPGKEYIPLKGKIDMKKVGMAGHSFGAVTTTAIAGQVQEDSPLVAKGLKFSDTRVTAGLAMSPYAPTRKGVDLDAVYAGIKIPLLYMSGTFDNYAGRAEDRKIPYQHSKVAGTGLLMLRGADHMTFAPIPELFEKRGKAAFQKLILQVSTAYWDAQLKGSETAKKWLAEGASKELGEKGTVEWRK
jgi:predicted dienelactone hydrolase